MKLSFERIFVHQRGEDGSVLDRLVRSSFRARDLDFAEPTTTAPFWEASYHGLAQARAWTALPLERRDELLRTLADGLMSEAFFIEQAGMVYAAKMNLLARSVEERTFFCLMGAEEATHFHRLSPWFPHGVQDAPIDSFSRLIAEIVGNADRREALVLIQVLLEGWGLTHYQSLAESTTCPQLGLVLRDIVQDESRHHAAGVILAAKAPPTHDSFLRDALERLLQMVRVGPAGVLSVLCEAHGGLPPAQFLETWNELGASESARDRLERIRRLLEKALPEDSLRAYERGGLFSAMSAEEARVALGL